MIKFGTSPNNLAEKVINELRKIEVIEKIESKKFSVALIWPRANLENNGITQLK